MQFMVIEKFKVNKLKEMYKRFDEKGRMLPPGVQFINSWVNEQVTVCYQLMDAVSISDLQEWIKNWNDLVDFEVIPVISSAEAKKRVLG